MAFSYTRNTLAGSGDDFMTVVHLIFKGNQKEMGKFLAQIAKDELQVQKQPWTDPVNTKAQREWMKEHWPQHFQRMQGAAEAFGIALDDDRFEHSFLYYYWGLPGCSNVYYPPSCTTSGHGVLARNYDFSTGTVFDLMNRPNAPSGYPNATARPFLVETYPDEGYATMVMSSYELLGGALDGINCQGLTVALLASLDVLHSPHYAPLQKNGVGLHEIQLVRFLLETCKDAAEAREALRTLPQFYMTVPCHFIIADKAGNAFVWGHLPNKEVLHIPGKPGKPTAITNHYPVEHQDVIQSPIREESISRLDRLHCGLAKAGGRSSQEDIQQAAQSVAATWPAGEGQYLSDKPARTLWHAFYDQMDNSLRIDFYLRDDNDGEIQRSEWMAFRLES